MGRPLVAFEKKDWDKWQWEFKFGPGIWDGKNWNESLVIHERDEKGRRIVDPKPYLIGNDLFICKTPEYTSNDSKLFVFKRYQDSFSKSIFTYACTSKVVSDFLTGKKCNHP